MLDDFTQYEFGPFRLDPSNRLVTRNHEPVPLAPRVFDTLVTLVRLRGRVVTKDELFRAVWSGSIVEESNLTVTISALRKALDDGDGKQKYVQTVPKFGYRFVADVAIVERGLPEPDVVPSIDIAPPPEQLSLVAASRKSRRVWTGLFVVLAVFSVAVLGSSGAWRFVHSFTSLAASSGSQPNAVAGTSGSPPVHMHAIASRPPEGGSCVGERDETQQGLRRTEVHALYLKGRYSASRGTERGLEHGVAYFRNAIAEDPCNALAYAGLADAYLSLPGWSIQSPKEAYAKAKEAAKRATELDDSLPQGHIALGMLALVQDWNFAVAEAEFRRGIELGPNEALAHQGLGMYWATTGRLEDALNEMRIARDLDPLSLDIGMKLGLIHFYSRQYDEAIAEYKKVIDLDPHYSVSHYMLGATYFVQRDFANAARELKVSSGLVNDREPLAFGLYAAARARMGDDTTARYVQADIAQRSHKEYICPTSMAVFYMGLGRLDEARPWIEEMFRDHLLDALLVNVSPLFDPVRSDRRVVSLLRSVKQKGGLVENRNSAWFVVPRRPGN